MFEAHVAVRRGCIEPEQVKIVATVQSLSVAVVAALALREWWVDRRILDIALEERDSCGALTTKHTTVAAPLVRAVLALGCWECQTLAMTAVSSGGSSPPHAVHHLRCRETTPILSIVPFIFYLIPHERLSRVERPQVLRLVVRVLDAEMADPWPGVVIQVCVVVD